jgi:hypothetical protein
MAQSPLFGVAIGIGIGIVAKVFGSIPIVRRGGTPTPIKATKSGSRPGKD